jgi:hypothetical protein
MSDFGVPAKNHQDNIAIIGTTNGIRECIDAKNNDIDSLLDNQDSRDILNGFGDELWVWYGLDTLGMEYNGLIASVASIEIVGSDGLKTNRVFKFKDEADALAALIPLRNEHESDANLINIDVEQNGEDLTIDADADIDYLDPRIDPPLLDNTVAEQQREKGEFIEEWVQLESWIMFNTGNQINEHSFKDRLAILEDLELISTDARQTIKTINHFRNRLFHGENIGQQELSDRLNQLSLIKQELPLN